MAKIIESRDKKVSSEPFSLSRLQLRFDTYSGTSRTSSAHDLLACLPIKKHRLWVGEGEASFQRYDRGLYITDGAGKLVGRILWGMSSDNVYFEFKGAMCNEFVSCLRESPNQHQVSRADVCLDSFEAEAFDVLVGHCQAVKATNHQIRAERRGDWDDHPELGLTYMLGSSRSLCQVVVYQKGRQREYRNMGVDEWVRCEWRVRPETRTQKMMAATLSADELILLSPMGRKLAARVLADFDGCLIPKLPKAKTSARRSFEYMLAQYRKTIIKVAKQDAGMEGVLSEIGLFVTGKPWTATELCDSYA